MRIGIAGYGRMGKIIHQYALNRGHDIPLIVDPSADSELVTARELSSQIPRVDVFIDFSHPGEVLKNIKLYAELNINAVVGTTGWYDLLPEAERIVNKSNIGLIWSGNFSMGVNIFFYLVRYAACIMNSFPAYDVAVREIHHRGKADSPSGTAEMLGEILLQQLEEKKELKKELDGGPISPSEINISSTRCGAVPGLHEVIFDGEVDTIKIEHNARGRDGFAEGAVLAAEWVNGKKGLYRIDDLMKSILGGISFENN